MSALHEMHICDRCGKTFDHFKEDIISGHAYYTVMLDYPNWRQNPAIIHLCADCQEELKKWMEDAHE